MKSAATAVVADLPLIGRHSGETATGADVRSWPRAGQAASAVTREIGPARAAVPVWVQPVAASQAAPSSML